MNSKISVIIPIYNTEKYIRKCIDSVINQTYKNIEIILINDGSNDKCEKICNEYLKKDNRIKAIHQEKNKGVSVARNLGIKLANGEYIVFVDSDDYIKKSFIEKLIINVDKNTDLIVENAINFDDKFFYSCKKIKNDIICNVKDFIKIMLNEKLTNNVCWGKLYKTDIVKKIQFSNNLKIAEDLDFNIKYLELCKNKIKIIKENDYFYHLNNSSNLKNNFNEKWFDEIKVCQNLINKFKNTDLEIFCIQRYIRINFSILTTYSLSKNLKLIFKNNINKYKNIYIKSKNIKFDNKIKIIIGYYFPKLIYFFRIIKYKTKIKKNCN